MGIISFRETVKCKECRRRVGRVLFIRLWLTGNHSFNWFPKQRCPICGGLLEEISNEELRKFFSETLGDCPGAEDRLESSIER